MSGFSNCSPVSSRPSAAEVEVALPTFPDHSNKQSNESSIKALLQRLPDLDNSFHIFGKIGEGTFSNVYLASLKGGKDDKKFAIKHLIPTSHPKRVKYELDCLYRIGGKDNVVSCEATLRQGDCVVFIMPYLQHQKFADYVFDMNVEEARLYMKNLFLALRRVHSFNIIHRDVKPSNFLYNRESKQFLLVDFGLAQKVNDSYKPCSVQKEDILFKMTGGKRKREDDDSENMDRPAVKRSALQTLPLDMNRQDIKHSAVLKFSRQPLSIQQQKCQSVNAAFHVSKSLGTNSLMNRKPLSSNSSNVIGKNLSSTNQMFQSLAPQVKNMDVDKGTSFVRVQNSQVQTGSLGLFPRPTAPVRRQDVCECSKKPQICNLCITRKSLHAPRAGTPGFRPPEVLLKYPNQTTAVDMWAAGIIMLCILSGCYPFFRSPDDVTALCELITVFGSSAIMNLARKLGRNIICSENRKPLSFLILCEYLRRRKMNGEQPQPGLPLCEDCKNSVNPKYGCLCESKCKLDLSKTLFPDSAFDLLRKLLDVNPDTRISADMALQHPFVTATD